MSRKTVMRMAIMFPLHVLLLLVVMGIHDSVSGSTEGESGNIKPSNY